MNKKSYTKEKNGGFGFCGVCRLQDIQFEKEMERKHKNNNLGKVGFLFIGFWIRYTVGFLFIDFWIRYTVILGRH